MAFSQNIIAIDARFNAFRFPSSPATRSHYIRRRTQLLNDKNRKELSDVNYLQLRLYLLQQRYRISFDQISSRSRLINFRTSSRQTVSEIDLSLTNLSGSMAQSLASDSCSSPGQVVPTCKASASKALVGSTSIAENYAFSGVHHIFDQHTDCVTMVKFAHNNEGLLACSSLDGTLSVCEVSEGEPRVLYILKHHTSGIAGFDWSCTNDLIVSAGHDSQICLWNVASAQLLRTVLDQSGTKVLSVVFNPINSNWIVAGNSSGLVEVLNVSTGLFPPGGTSTVVGEVTALTFNYSGDVLWVGDSKGNIISFSFDLACGKLRKGKRMLVKEGYSVTSLSARMWANREARNPSLLVNCMCNNLLVYSMVDNDGGLKLKRIFDIPHSSYPIHSTFSPLMSFRQGSCVVSGSEDCSVWFLDIERDSKGVINKLQGHSTPVVSVSFNYNESFLGTSDMSGLVIIWKREKNR